MMERDRESRHLCVYICLFLFVCIVFVLVTFLCVYNSIIIIIIIKNINKVTYFIILFLFSTHTDKTLMTKSRTKINLIHQDREKAKNSNITTAKITSKNNNNALKQQQCHIMEPK